MRLPSERRSVLNALDTGFARIAQGTAQRPLNSTALFNPLFYRRCGNAQNRAIAVSAIEGMRGFDGLSAGVP